MTQRRGLPDDFTAGAAAAEPTGGRPPALVHPASLRDLRPGQIAWVSRLGRGWVCDRVVGSNERAARFKSGCVMQSTREVKVEHSWKRTPTVIVV